MDVELPELSGIKIHLSFEAYFDFMALDADTVEKEQKLFENKKATAKEFKDLWGAWIQFVFDNKVVQAWDVVDADGNVLDPRKLDDYRKISVFDFRRIRYAIGMHNKGVIETAKN